MEFPKLTSVSLGLMKRRFSWKLVGMSLAKETSGESPYNEIGNNTIFSSSAQFVSGRKATTVRHEQKAISHPSDSTKKKATSKYGA